MLYEIFKQLDRPFTGEELFDSLSDIVFFIKNRDGEYLAVNKTLVARCGFKQKKDLIGRKASQVLRAPMGKSFSEQDQIVLQTGRPLLSQLELHIYPSGDPGWCVTTKFPLRKKGGACIGLVGVSQDLRLPDFEAREYQHVASAVRDAESRVSDLPSVLEMAQKAKMTRYQLDRRMYRVFGLNTGHWLIKIRIDHAQRLLVETEFSIARIALESGYSDQSAFTRQFRKSTGLSPREYRCIFQPE